VTSEPETATGESAGSTADAVASGDDQTGQRDILRAQIREGVSELQRPVDGLFLSAVSAGLDIGFGPLLMAVVLSVAEFSFPTPLVEELLLANAYAFGFVLVVLGRSELFTEHTTLAVLPVLNRQATLGQLGRPWGTVYLGNVLGGALFAGFAVLVAPALGVAEPRAFVEIAASVADHGWWVLLAASVLAGWLMGLLSWLVAAAQDTISRLVFVWLIAAAIGFAHLPHSIAGTVEVLARVFVTSALSIRGFARFLTAATVGNAIGGAVFVGLLKYSHVVRSVPAADRVDID